MILWFTLITSQHYFIISPVLLKSSLYIYFLSSWANMSCIENVRHFLTSTEIVLLNQSFSLSNNYLCHHMIYLFFLLLACVRSTIITSYSLNQVLHIFVASSVYIIVKVSTSRLVVPAYWSLRKLQDKSSIFATSSSIW